MGQRRGPRLVRTPPRIVSLGTMRVGRGVALETTNDKDYFHLAEAPPGFAVWGTGGLGPIPAPVVITGGVFAVACLPPRSTRLGLSPARSAATSRRPASPTSTSPS